MWYFPCEFIENLIYHISQAESFIPKITTWYKSLKGPFLHIWPWIVIKTFKFPNSKQLLTHWVSCRCIDVIFTFLSFSFFLLLSSFFFFFLSWVSKGIVWVTVWEDPSRISSGRNGGNLLPLAVLFITSLSFWTASVFQELGLYVWLYKVFLTSCINPWLLREKIWTSTKRLLIPSLYCNLWFYSVVNL